jgi:hypothetical protein
MVVRPRAAFVYSNHTHTHTVIVTVQRWRIHHQILHDASFGLCV